MPRQVGWCGWEHTICFGNVAPRLPAEPPLTQASAVDAHIARRINIARTLPDAGWQS